MTMRRYLINLVSCDILGIACFSDHIKLLYTLVLVLLLIMATLVLDQKEGIIKATSNTHRAHHITQ